MFDLTSSKLLILGIVALIVVGPKELPFLLRTIGKYVGMIRRQANEFRAQFDEAMREAELDSLKKEVEAVARDAEDTIRDAQATVEHDVQAATADLDHAMQPVTPVEADQPHHYDALNGLDTGTPHPVVEEKLAHGSEVTVTPAADAEASADPLHEASRHRDASERHEAAAATAKSAGSLAKTGS